MAQSLYCGLEVAGRDSRRTGGGEGDRNPHQEEHQEHAHSASENAGMKWESGEGWCAVCASNLMDSTLLSGLTVEIQLTSLEPVWNWLEPEPLCS